MDKPDKRIEAIEASIAQMHKAIADKVAAKKPEDRNEKIAAAVAQGIQAGMTQIADAMRTPKRVVYGPDRQIIGVEPMVKH